MGKIIVIGSQKGGVGKTTTTHNLAYSLKELGKKVLTVDFDSQANLTTCYGVEDTGALEYTIGHLMMDQMEEEVPESFEDYIQSRDGVDYLPSSIYLSVVDAKLRTEMGAERMLAEVLEPLKSRYDYILIDTCPSLGMLKTIWNSAVKFFKKSIVNQEGYVPPDEYNADFESASLKPEDYSDIGQAKVLVREYGNELKYTSATDFLRFDGECWREDKQMAIGAVEEFLDLQLQDAMDEVARVEKALENAGVPKESIQAGPKELLKEVDGKLIPLVYMLMGAQTYLKFVQKRRDYKYIVSAANTAKPMIAISVSDLDKNENLINTPYATYDLRKGLAGELPHNPEDLITKITACSPGEEGKKIWMDALNLFFCKDQKLIDYVQETVGMAAIGKVYQEHMIIAYGGGANGKSTFWNTIFRVLGNYAGKLSAEALTMNCKRNVKPEMAELKGKRLIISSEMEEGMRLNTAVVKQLCSTDEIQAEKKYKDPFSFVPSHTLVLYTNHLPKVGANDDGIWRRLVVIPFNAKITGKSDIKNYADYLFEHAGPAIMSWIIEGAKRAIDKNFHTTLPDVVEAAIQAYREDNDWLGQFLEECCEIDPSYKEKSGELYQAYRAHCMQNGEYIRSTTDFYSSMDKAGYNRIRKNTGVQVVGLKLKEGQDFLE